MFITTDHGRGDIKKDEWQTHGQKIADAGQIWFAVLSPVTSAKGEIKENIQLYQQQFAQTIAALLGYTFTCEHEVAKPIDNVLH